MDMLGFQHGGAQTRAGRNLDFGEVELLVATCLLLHLVIAFQTGLVLGLTGLRRGAHPVEFVLQALGELGVLGALNLHTLGLGLQVSGVVTLIRVQVTAIDLADPFGHVVHEVTVVGDGDDGTLVLVQELLQPQDRLGIEVVRGLVEQQQVRSFEQQLAQCHTAAFTTGAYGHRSVRVRALQGVHGLLELGVEIPAVGGVDVVLQLAHLFHQGVEVGIRIGHFLTDLVETGHLFGDFAERHLDVLADGLGLVQRRLLLQDADGESRGQIGFAVGDGVDAGHDLEQRGLAHAVRADDADLGARQEAQGHVIENHAVAVSLAGLDHLINEFSQCCVPSLRNVGIPACCMSKSTEISRLEAGPCITQSTVLDYPIPRLHAGTNVLDWWPELRSGGQRAEQVLMQRRTHHIVEVTGFRALHGNDQSLLRQHGGDLTVRTVRTIRAIVR